MIKDLAAYEARERAFETARRARWAQSGSVKEAEALLTSDVMRFVRASKTRPRCLADHLSVPRDPLV